MKSELQNHQQSRKHHAEPISQNLNRKIQLKIKKATPEKFKIVNFYYQF